MNEKNLPIMLILPRDNDIKKNQGGGDVKYFGEITDKLKSEIIHKFESVLAYYGDTLEKKQIPAVCKIKVKKEAIAKSHKPNDFCQYCPIIGGNKLDELYIKIDKSSVENTIKLIKNPPSRKFEANLTTILDILPITNEEKISQQLLNSKQKNQFEKVKSRIKIKFFDFDNEFDNQQITEHVIEQLSTFGFSEYSSISYGLNIKYLKVKVNSYTDIVKLSSINGIKQIDLFQEYHFIGNELKESSSAYSQHQHYEKTDTQIGIIDTGVSLSNQYLQKTIIAKESFVPSAYQNNTHATFIASTIQYGNELNGVQESNPKEFKLVDIVAIPNSDSSIGAIDTIDENELMDIIETVVKKYSDKTKIWNLSVGIENQICDGNISDLGAFLDYIQTKYNVQFFIPSGNYSNYKSRTWPPSQNNEYDRIISPADSVMALTVGSLALYDSNTSIVKKDQPSPFSRKGPGTGYTVKPELVDYGGNISHSDSINSLGMKGMDINGNITEGIGTSYSTPRIVRKFATIYDEMIEKDLLLSKAMLIHSARMNMRDSLDKKQDHIKYYGFGMPAINAVDILQCSDSEVTLIFKQTITAGSHLEMFDFPYPNSLIKNGKCFGEIGMTLIYEPTLDFRYGHEYCRSNVDVSFGIYKYNEDGEIQFKGQVPLEKAWDQKYEKGQVENGFKWSPIKSYFRKMPKGIDYGEGWKIRVDMTSRNRVTISKQEFALIVTIKDPSNSLDIYTEMVNGLRNNGYITNNLETRQLVRQRNK